MGQIYKNNSKFQMKGSEKQDRFVTLIQVEMHKASLLEDWHADTNKTKESPIEWRMDIKELVESRIRVALKHRIWLGKSISDPASLHIKQRR